jgi:hypothetical protein
MKVPVCCWLVDEAGDTGLGEGRQRPPRTAWSGKKNTSDSASSTMKSGKLIVSLIKCAPLHVSLICAMGDPCMHANVCCKVRVRQDAIIKAPMTDHGRPSP